MHPVQIGRAAQMFDEIKAHATDSACMQLYKLLFVK
jgi:hypothetical protein